MCRLEKIVIDYNALNEEEQDIFVGRLIKDNHKKLIGDLKEKFKLCKNEKRIGEVVFINPQVTNKEEWIEGKIVDIENNTFCGIVITVETTNGEFFFEKEEMFKKNNMDKLKKW